MLVYTVYAYIYMHIMYIYLYTYIYTISGLFFGSTVAALGVRMYWKSELKILICPGAVSPNDGGEIISPSSMEPVMRDGISNIPTLHCTLPGNFTHEPINESRISTKPCTKKTLLLIFTSKSFQLCIWGNFFRGSEIKDATCFARIHHLRYLQIHLPLAVWKPPTQGNESRWR